MPRRGAVYHVQGRPDPQPQPLPFTVVAVAGEWLDNGDVEIRIRDVIPVDEAPAYYEEWIRREPQSAWAYRHRGILVGTAGELDRAAADFDRAIALDPNDAEAYCLRGVLHATIEEEAAALRDFETALRLRPDYADAYHHRGSFHEDRGETEQALADYDAALRAAPHFSDVHNSRAILHQTAGRLAEALADYDAALRLNPEFVEALCNRSLLRSAGPDPAFRDGAQAVRDAERACELTKRKDAGCLDTLAAAYAETGDFDRAAVTAQGAVLLAPREDKPDYRARLRMYLAREPYRYAE
jgi:tetratricopeptide (TPR) repeat protein